MELGEFFTAFKSNIFLQNALLTGLLVSVACGVVGSFVVTRRISFIAGSISHFILGGMGAARYFSVVYGWEGLRPFHGALISALFAAIIIGLVSMHFKEREDTVVGALWAVGMAVGIIFIVKTPGYASDLMGYLFGNILMVSSSDLWIILLLDILVLAVSLVFYKPLLAVCFDEEFARLRGVNAQLYYIMLLCLTALTVVLMVTTVGIVLVIALLTLPAGVAGLFSRKLWQMMILAIVLCGLFTTAGLIVSFSPNLPAGAVIIVLAGAVYLVAVLAKDLIHSLKVGKESQ